MANYLNKEQRYARAAELRVMLRTPSGPPMGERMNGTGHYFPDPPTARKRKPSDRKRFIRSKEWRTIRLECFDLWGRDCLCCGSSMQIQVDHIKPRSKFPDLALCLNNLQPLCWKCNKKKGTVDMTDYRQLNC